MKNEIYIGISKALDLPDSGYLFIDDEVKDISRARVFDPKVHAFNPFKALDYRKACDLVDMFDILFSRGENTLTKDTGLDFIGDALSGDPQSIVNLIPEPDRKASTGHIWAHGKVQRLLRSPVLKRMLTSPTNFSFKPRSSILARVNRAELGEFDALAIGLLLMSHYKGQLVVPDFGFYAREHHSALLRENRLIAGVNFLEELPHKLRRLCLLQPTVPSGAIFEDAETLASAAQLIRGTNEYNDFVHQAMSARADAAPPVTQSFLVERTRLYAARTSSKTVPPTPPKKQWK